MRIGGEVGYRLLRWLKPGSGFQNTGESLASYIPVIKRVIGDEGWESLRGKTVADFGCGIGVGCLEIARHGARRVIGLDIRQDLLAVARESAEAAGVSAVCAFCRECDEPVDVIVSKDAFEHFEDPAAVLRTMHGMLKDDGFVLLSFGPTWYHPLGGHLFSVFPWSHLLFSEEAQIRWRSEFKTDGATRFGEVEGGLNRMTIQRFVNLVHESGFQFQSFHPIPIKPLAWAHNRLTRECTTSVVDCVLVKKNRSGLRDPDQNPVATPERPVADRYSRAGSKR